MSIDVRSALAAVQRSNPRIEQTPTRPKVDVCLLVYFAVEPGPYDLDRDDDHSLG